MSDATKPRRTRRTAKQAGASFERLIADHLATELNDDRIDRRPKRGANDRGDIGGVKFLGHRVVIECKDVSKLNLPGWLREAEVERGNDDALIGVVVHKKRGTAKAAEQYVTLTVDTLVKFLQAGVRG